jgi:hypothetical protein
MRILSFLLVITGLLSCSESETPENEYSGKSISYSLFSGNDQGVPGTVEFKEKVDGSLDIIITLEDLSGDAMLPVHLHFGDLSNPEAPQAALLDSYIVEKGVSKTNISFLADDSPFTFDRVAQFDGSIKVHLSHVGDDYNVIVAAGNIGSNESKGFNLETLSVCSPDLGLN